MLIIMQHDENRCSSDVIEEKAEEKLLRSKDNHAGAKLIIDIGAARESHCELTTFLICTSSISNSFLIL